MQNRKRIALFKSEYGSELLFLCPEEATNTNDSFMGNVRISEFVYVDFHPREQAEIVVDEVKVLDTVLDELMKKIQAIRSKKSELLALAAE